MKRRVARWTLGAASLTLLCQCANEPHTTQSAPPRAGAEPRRALVGFAAASLRGAFEALGTAFEATRPGTLVTFQFAGSQELRTQIEHGARADVFASADRQQLQLLENARLVEIPAIFARNELVLAVSKDSARDIRAFTDLPLAARLVIGSPEVPIGRYTSKLLDRTEHSWGSRFRSQIETRVVSRELNVRQVLAKVSLGEADAGIVYRSDLMGVDGGVELIPIPAELNVVAEYPIARVQASAQPELARDFIGLVLSPVGQSALKKAGFEGASESRVTP